MKRLLGSAIVIGIILIVVLICACPDTQYTCGRLRIPEVGIDIELTTSVRGSDCGCCGILWHGGITYTMADIRSVPLYAMAHLITIDMGRTVLECVEIIQCIRFGNWLVSRHGIVQPNGDLLVVCGCIVYRFTPL